MDLGMKFMASATDTRVKMRSRKNEESEKCLGFSRKHTFCMGYEVLEK